MMADESCKRLGCICPDCEKHLMKDPTEKCLECSKCETGQITSRCQRFIDSRETERSTGIRDTAAYKLSALILTREEPFTLEEIFEELKEWGVDESKEAVKLALRRLRDAGIIHEQNSRYSLSNWGWV